MPSDKKKFEQRKLIRFTQAFWDVLDNLRESDLVWAISEIESNPTIQNTLNIEEVDVSDTEFKFNVKIAGKYQPMKISRFIKNLLGSEYSDEDILEFSKEYNKKILSPGQLPSEYINVGEFNFDPKNVRETFLSLVQETYPHGHEEEVVMFLPKGLSKDSYGNYYKVIGKSDTVFTCHLDTASRTKSGVVLVSYEKDGEEIIITDQNSILGADDKAGVTILMYMMAHNIPGVYWFFIGEERGGIGSGKVAGDFESYDFMKGKKKVVSFDRRNYYSVITKQMGVECCSNEFAKSLCDELNKSGLSLGLDPTGVFTDSANFIDLVPECTNVSVGYFNEHTHDEMQNITYLEKLAKACISVDWDNLVIKRKIGFDDEVMKKHARLIREVKKSYFYNNSVIKGSDNKVIIELQVVDGSPDYLHRDLIKLETILKNHRLTPDIKFQGSSIKIEIE